MFFCSSLQKIAKTMQSYRECSTAVLVLVFKIFLSMPLEYTLHKNVLLVLGKRMLKPCIVIKNANLLHLFSVQNISKNGFQIHSP